MKRERVVGEVVHGGTSINEFLIDRIRAMLDRRVLVAEADVDVPLLDGRIVVLEVTIRIKGVKKPVLNG